MQKWSIHEHYLDDVPLDNYLWNGLHFVLSILFRCSYSASTLHLTVCNTLLHYPPVHQASDHSDCSPLLSCLAFGFSSCHSLIPEHHCGFINFIINSTTAALGVKVISLFVWGQLVSSVTLTVLHSQPEPHPSGRFCTDTETSPELMGVPSPLKASQRMLSWDRRVWWSSWMGGRLWCRWCGCEITVDARCVTTLCCSRRMWTATPWAILLWWRVGWMVIHCQWNVRGLCVFMLCVTCVLLCVIHVCVYGVCICVYGLCSACVLLLCVMCVFHLCL